MASTTLHFQLSTLHFPRVLPFPRDGYGQDDEWVMANFTNSTEILAVGYPQWVDAQVGVGKLLMSGFSDSIGFDLPSGSVKALGDEMSQQAEFVPVGAANIKRAESEVYSQ